MNRKTVLGVVFIALLTLSCAATIEVLPGGAVITAPMFEGCDGVTFHLIVRQPGKPTVEADGTIMRGRLEFESPELKELDFSQTMILEMRVTSATRPGCEFEHLADYVTDPTIPDPAGKDRYTVKGDKFRKL